VHGFFFQILHRDTSIDMVYETLMTLFLVESALLHRLKSSNRLEIIREVDRPPSDKIAAFLTVLQEDAGLDLVGQASIKGCLEAIKDREGAGVVNALLVNTECEIGLVIPLHIKVQPGNGQVHLAVNGHGDFEATLKRVRLALLDQGFLRDADDVICTLELTESNYRGTSIGLAAALGMYGAARGMIIDPYTAFTGDINMDRGQWQVKGVSGLPQKLKAACLNGCRRVFIPRENLADVSALTHEGLQILPVDNFVEILLQLQSQPQPLPGNSLQIRKINALRACCQDQGWELSPPRSIQDGLQFCVAPLHLPETAINIYTTGTHTPKQHNLPEYQKLLDVLQELERPKISLRKVEEKFTVKDPSLRSEIRAALEQLQPAEQREERYCQYVFRFEQGQERLIVKQFQNGSLQVQGNAGELYKALFICRRSRQH
jgi:hypothetical protein